MTYKKSYRMRAVGEGGYNIVVSLPPEVIRREAEMRNLSVPEFINQYIAVAQYNDIKGVLYTFKERE